MSKKRVFAFGSFCALAALATAGAAMSTPAVQTSAVSNIGIDTAGMDKSVKPGDDFYSYANGSWMKSAEIPADRASTGVFLEVFNKAEARTAELIASLVAGNPARGTDEARIADYYRAYMDTGAIDAAGMKPVQAELNRYAAIRNKADLSSVIGSTIRADVDPLNSTDYSTGNLFGVFVSQGLNTPGEVIPYLLQGGLGLPEREYYLSDTPRMVQIRSAYSDYLEKLLTASGFGDAKFRADRVLALETKIAKAHADRARSEDFTKSTAVWTQADFTSKAPGMDWPAFFNAAKLGKQNKFNAYHDEAITRLSSLVASEPLEAWKDWLSVRHINAYSDVLPTAIDDLRFSFYGTTLSGTPKQTARRKRALGAVSTQLGDAVGRLYAARYFPASSKAEISSMVDNINTAFTRRVQNLAWMAPETKREAIRKIETLKVGLGYPESWRNYSNYTVSPNAAYENKVGGSKAEYAHQLAKIGKPFDKNEWWMSPQTVNAVNLPVQNALNFPAAILESPFFDPKADAAANFGAIGGVIGHEISHSFDNNGAVFDADGVMRNWWTKEDFARFEKEGKALADQYDAYAPFPDLHVNGKLTLAENIADVAGLSAAYDAYRTSLNGKEAPVIGGLTGDQRFFIAFAQAWRTKAREKAMRQTVATDAHAPGQYRALTVRNLEAWYKAFDVKPGDALYLPPEKRITVW